MVSSWSRFCRASSRACRGGDERFSILMMVVLAQIRLITIQLQHNELPILIPQTFLLATNEWNYAMFTFISGNSHLFAAHNLTRMKKTLLQFLIFNTRGQNKGRPFFSVMKINKPWSSCEYTVKRKPANYPLKRELTKTKEEHFPAHIRKCIHFP